MSISDIIKPNYYNIYANKIITNINNIDRNRYTPIITSLNNCSISGGGGEYISIGSYVLVNNLLIIMITNPALNSSMEISVPVPRQDGNFLDSLRTVGFGMYKDSSVNPLFSTIFIESVGGTQRIKLYLAPIPGGINSYQLEFQYNYDGVN